jgi:hypothetical protein
MKTTTRLACALAIAAVAVTGCGGGDSGTAADTAAINDLVAEINRANTEKDGGAYCDLLQPSAFLDSFNSRNECATETNQILEQSAVQPDLVVEDITIDGDTAMVSFVGRSGEAPLVKEGDSWYLALGQATAAPADDADAGAAGTDGDAGSTDGGTGSGDGS